MMSEALCDGCSEPNRCGRACPDKAADPSPCSHGYTQAHYTLATGGYCHGPASKAICEHGYPEDHLYLNQGHGDVCPGPSPAVLPDTEPPVGHG